LCINFHTLKPSTDRIWIQQYKHSGSHINHLIMGTGQH